MTGEELLKAIGDLDDRFVMEYAQPKSVAPQKETGRVHWVLPVAASLCLLAGGLSLYFMDGGDPWIYLQNPSGNSTVSTTRPTVPQASSRPEGTASEVSGTVIWGGADEMLNQSFGGEYPIDTVSVRPLLQGALDRYLDPQVRFAVQLWDAAGADEAIVYEKVLEDLGLDGNTESMVLFLTRAQIDAVRCPEGMALCLGLASKETIRHITLDVLEALEQETILVQVFLKFSDLYAYYNQAYDNGQFESAAAMNMAKQAEMTARLEACATELGLSRQEILNWRCFATMASFTAELHKEQIRRLLTEEQFDNLYQISETFEDIYYEELYEGIGPQ